MANPDEVSVDVVDDRHVHVGQPDPVSRQRVHPVSLLIIVKVGVVVVTGSVRRRSVHADKARERLEP